MIKNVMSLAMRILLVLFLSQMPRDGYAYHVEESPLRSGFGLITGYKTINMGDEITFSHDTYPDDNYLPNANVPGSAGTTTIGPDLEFAYVGITYQTPLSSKFLMNAALGFLKDFRTNVDFHQADNDPRASKYATHVYSDARVGGFSSLGFSYYFKRFILGAEAEVDVIKITHSWDRPRGDYTQEEEWVWMFSAGPKIGYYLFKNLSIEASYLLGSESNFNALLRWYFFY